MALRSLLAAAAAFLVVFPAAAGASPGEGKCPYTTQECLDMMTRRMKSGGFIGVELDTADPKVWRVTQVYAGSPAEKAGIRPGDILAALNGVALPAADEAVLRKARGEWVPGQQVTYSVLRDGVPRPVTLTLAPWPADVLARQIGQHMMEHASIASRDPGPKRPVP